MILGLPRSRTAWLSSFMSQSSVFFYHEAINGCKSIEDYNKKVAGGGDSTTAFMFLGDSIKSKKKVIIKKNKSEFDKCVEWANNAFGGDNRQLLIDMSNKLDSYEGLVVNQSDINDKLKDIWEYLVDDKWNDKYASLTSLNIQVSSYDIDESAAKAFYETI